jgi:hypothetical protein
MRKHATLLIVVMAFTLGGLAGALAWLKPHGRFTETGSHTAWREIALCHGPMGQGDRF